jgi:hypothetical protein
MKYLEPAPSDRWVLEDALRLGDVEGACHALVGLVHYDSDWEWLQNKCLDLLGDDNVSLKGVAISSLGHIARIHGKLDRIKVEVALKNLMGDSSLKGRVVDALSDIEVYLQ